MADFDPNAFVAGDDFDPHAFVAEPEEGGPESFLHPDKFKPSRGQRKLNNTGPMEQVRAELDPRQHSTDVGELLAGQPLSTADRYTGGALTSALRFDRDVLSKNPIARAVDEIPILGPLIGKHGGETADQSLRSMNNYRNDNPTLAQYTDIPGYMGGAPKAIAMGVERVLPQATRPLAQAARATLAAGISSATTAGAESAARGDAPVEIAREAGRGGIGGAAVGAPLSVGSLMLRGAANAVLGSKGAKARAYLESRGQPLTAPDTSDAAIGAAAQRTDGAVKDAMAGYKQKVASGPYMDAINEITPEKANGLVELSPVYDSLLQAAQDPTNLRVIGQLKDLVGMLESRQTMMPDGSKTILMTEQQLNGLRQSLAGIAGVGESNAAKLSPLKAAYHHVKALVDEGPYAEANRRNTAGMSDFNSSLDMVGLRSTTNPDEPVAGNLRVASQRQGQNTVTAGADTERLNLDAFKAKHPDLADAIDAPEILRNQGDLSFHMGSPAHGGLIDRVAGSLPLPAMIAAYAMGHGLKGAAAAAAMMAYQNRNALAGRVLHGPAQEAQIAAQLMLQGTPAIAAPGRDVADVLPEMRR